MMKTMKTPVVMEAATRTGKGVEALLILWAGIGWNLFQRTLS
jgi:hypothetical protein